MSSVGRWMDVGFVTQLSWWGEAVDKSPCDGMAAKYWSVGVCTQPPRQWRPRCSYGTDLYFSQNEIIPAEIEFWPLKCDNWLLVLCKYSKFWMESNSYFNIRFETNTIIRNFRILNVTNFLLI